MHARSGWSFLADSRAASFDLKKAQKLLEVFFYASHGSGIDFSPAGGETPVCLGGFAVIGGMADSTECFFDRRLIFPFHFVQDVSGLMRPAALQQRFGIDDLKGCVKSRSTIGANQFTDLALEPSLIQIA